MIAFFFYLIIYLSSWNILYVANVRPSWGAITLGSLAIERIWKGWDHSADYGVHLRTSVVPICGCLLEILLSFQHVPSAAISSGIPLQLFM